jgi:hypothetical protein
MIRALILLLVFLAVQAPPNPDDYVGDEDPAHKGQPKSCSNSPRIKAVRQDCKCEKKTKEACDPAGRMEDNSCFVYCRKPACKCFHKACETE